LSLRTAHRPAKPPPITTTLDVFVIGGKLNRNGLAAPR
jgi:hypothetical protein